MTDLASLQQEIFACLHHGAALNQLEIVETNNVSLETRLAIYQQAYVLRLSEALAINHPVLAAILGEQAFAQLAQEYIARHPSEFKSIRWFGHEFATFILKHHDYKNQPAYAELAHFEWLQTCVFDAADDHIVTLQEIAQIPPDEWGHLVFTIHSSVHRMNLNWNVVAVWQAVIANESPPAFVENARTVPWILWRQNNLNRFSSLPDEEVLYLDALIAGASFAEILHLASEQMPVELAAPHVASLLKGWLDVGLISKWANTRR
jgi:hypothetical protein